MGGIHANNTYPAEFIYQNLMMQANVIHAAHPHGVQKLLFLGSSCIYPKLAPQPMAEENVGFGSDVTIDELAHAICGVVGYGGRIEFDSTKLDGAPRKWMDSTCRRKFGWRPKETLLAGLRKAYADYL